VVGGRYGRYDERWEVSGGGRTSLFGRRWMELSHYTWQSIFMCLTFVSLDPHHARTHLSYHAIITPRDALEIFDELIQSSGLSIPHLKTTIIKISMVDG